MPADLVTVIEAIYRLEADSEDWLRGIAQASAAALGKPHFGAYAMTYDASDTKNVRFEQIALVNVENPRTRRFIELDIQEAYQRSPAMVEAVFRRTTCGPSSRLPLDESFRRLHERFSSFGFAEILGLNGVNLDGRGAHAGILFPKHAEPFDGDLLARLSSHLAAGFRLRQRLEGRSPLEHAEAVVDASGKVVHAIGDAKMGEVRALIAQAATRLDRIRSASGRRDPERAVRLWKALVDARWSLVDHFESGGKRYVLAQRNDATAGPFELLTERELQVVAIAALGHSNKMIGYELGIAASTAGVLLARASRKIGTSSRRALIEAYESRAHAAR